LENDIAKTDATIIFYEKAILKRKCLGYKTPYEVFEDLTGINMKGYALIT
jgi:IS30 family transposase